MSLRVLAVALLLATLPARAEWSAPDADIPIRSDGASWTVDVTLNGSRRARFLLDTGATYCVIAPRLAREMAIAPSGSSVSVNTANGTVRAPVVRLRSLAIGNAKARDLQAIVHDAVGASLDGVVGLNFLNQYRYAIDPRRRVLRLH